MGIWQDFRDFVTGRGVIQTAVAFVIGLAVVALVTAVVTGFITPLIGLALGNTNLSQYNVTVTVGDHSSTFQVGLIVNAGITFVAILLVLFLAIVYPMARLERRRKEREKAAPTTKECPFCLTTVPIKATRCPACTSPLSAEPAK